MMRTVTCNDEKLVVFGDFMGCNVRVCGDNLLFGGEVCGALEFKVAQGPGEGEVAIDSAKVDEPSCSTYPRFFSCRQTVRRGSAAKVGLECRNRGVPSFCGLWSKESGLARPLTPRTDLESPALAYQM